MLQIKDRVRETTTSTGVGVLALAGPAAGFRAFSAVCSVADTCYYAIEAIDNAGVPTGDWEVGLGTYSAANQLTRTTVLASSNAGAAVNFAAGTKYVWIDFASTQLSSFIGRNRRNLLINGNFVVNQRAYASAAVLASGNYGHDRWKAGASGGDYSFAQLPNSTTITIAAGKTLIQVIEDKNVEGGTYTLSWTGTAQARFGINSAVPAGAYAPSPITITTQTPGTVMSVEFNAGTLTDAQLEAGSLVSSFERRPFPTELRLCERYYQICGKGATGGWHSATQAALGVPFRTPMRVAPTTVALNTTTPTVAEPGVAVRVGAASTVGVYNNAHTTLGMTVLVGGFAAATAANAALMDGDYITAAAEL